MEIRNKVVVVTGGAGFIGSHLADRLILEKPEKIIVASNFFLGKLDNLKEAKSKFENLEVCNIDITDYKEFKRLIEKNSTDIIFNLAVIPLPTSLEKPEWTFEQNLKMSLNVCELFRLGLFKKLVQFSSSEAYGSAVCVPMDEKHPLNPSTPYAASKAATDHLALSYNKTFGLDICVVRPFNNYGPRQNAGKYAGLIPLTVTRILNNEDLIIQGTGSQTRDFIYVTDTADAAVNLCKCGNAVGKIVNVASGKELTINYIVNMIKSLMEYKKAIIYKEARIGDVQRHFADIKLAKELIDFEPKVSFEEGIRKTVEWYKKI